MTLLELHVASGSPLDVRRFFVREAISEPFEVTVVARTTDASLDLGAIVGQPAEFRIVSGVSAAPHDERRWSGICRLAELDQAEPTGLSTYRFELVSALWLLGQRRDYRIVQRRSAPEVATEPLDRWGLERALAVDAGAHPKLPYKVQYGETDYAFLSRILEEAGIAFSFPAGEAGHGKLTLGDRLHEGAPRSAPIPFVENPNEAAEREFVSEVRLSDQSRPGAYTVRDHDFRRPAYRLFGEASRAAKPEGDHEQYHYRPGAFLAESAEREDTLVADDRGAFRHDQGEGQRLAERALAAERTGKRLIEYRTNVLDLWPGRVFNIARHPHPDLREAPRLLVAELTIEGAPGEAWTHRGRALFAATPYRPPRRTPRPRARLQSATVVGPVGTRRRRSRMNWHVTKDLTGPARRGPIVPVALPILELARIEFKNKFTIYASSNEAGHVKAAKEPKPPDPGLNLKGKNLSTFAKGDKLSAPEWDTDRRDEKKVPVVLPVALMRTSALQMEVTLRWGKTVPPNATSGTLLVSPTLDKKDKTSFKHAEAQFTTKAGEREVQVLVHFSGNLPDDVGRFLLELHWKAKPTAAPADFQFAEEDTSHYIYSLYGHAYKADDDNSSGTYAGTPLGMDTITGTPLRLEKWSESFDDTSRRQLADNSTEILWKMHARINDRGNPPFFDAVHDVHITDNGDKQRVLGGDGLMHGTGRDISVEDQWLMWAKSVKPNWNTGACISYVQLLKTMAAAVGLFTRRAWVMPRTNVVPPGGKLMNDDGVCWGNLDENKKQIAYFPDPDVQKKDPLKATLCLIEPGPGFENFEACSVTPSGRFFPGGYPTSRVDKDARGFIVNRGFLSAPEVLHWWCSTKRGSFQRFLCWITVDDDLNITNCWDRDGKHYPPASYRRILATGKQVPPW